MEKIQLPKPEMEILLAAKDGGVENVKKAIFQLVYGEDDVDYDDKNSTLIYWLEKTVNSIVSQQHKRDAEIDISISDYLRYVESYKRIYDKNISLYDGVVYYLAGKLRNCRFRYNGEDIFEITDRE